MNRMGQIKEKKYAIDDISVIVAMLNPRIDKVVCT